MIFGAVMLVMRDLLSGRRSAWSLLVVYGRQGVDSRRRTARAVRRLPQRPAASRAVWQAYREYMGRSTEFIRARNARIDRYAIAILAVDT
jgi:hypothetical protein